MEKWLPPSILFRKVRRIRVEVMYYVYIFKQPKWLACAAASRLINLSSLPFETLQLFSICEARPARVLLSPLVTSARPHVLFNLSENVRRPAASLFLSFSQNA